MPRDAGSRWARTLAEEERDDRFLTWREKTARALAMLPMTLTPLLWVSVRPHLAISTATSAAVLIVWFLAWTGVLALVVVRTRQRARHRRASSRHSPRPSAPVGPNERRAADGVGPGNGVGPGDGVDDDLEGGHAGSRRSPAPLVAVRVSFDDSHRPTLVFDNADKAPVHGLSVFCFHFANVLSRTYPFDEPHHGRKTLTDFNTFLTRRFGDDPELARSAQLVAACSFRDVDGRWWSQAADTSLVEARDGDDAWRRAFSAPSGRTGPQLWQILE